jgi:hypothetical protein
MRNYKALLASFIEIVTFLFASFGGFLGKIAPPQQTQAPYTVGVMSFLALIILLITSAISRSVAINKYRRSWIIAGALAFVLALPPTFLYHEALVEHTWSLPGESVLRVRGDYTDDVKKFLKIHPEEGTPGKLIQDFDINEIWTEDSLRQAESKLVRLYAWLVLSLSTSIFCLLEANVVEPKGHMSETKMRKSLVTASR